MKRLAALAFAALTTAATPSPGPAQTIDMRNFKMTVYVYKQGLFSFLADNHVIDAPITSGTYDPHAKTVNLVVDAAKMRVIDPALSTGKRAEVQSNMLGPKVLDVAQYPTIRFESTSLQATGDGRWSVTGNLHLHGQTHSLSFEVRNDAAGRLTGFAMVRQSEYGIARIKIAGGAVSVKDDVRVEFSHVTDAR